jgi:hypothetical protein
MVYCDVTNKEPELRFIRFPDIDKWLDLKHGRRLPEKSRNVAVVKSMIWFINIDHGKFGSKKTFGGRFGTEGIAASSISVYALMPDLKWLKKRSITLKKLWSLMKYKNCPLPKSVPEFPFIDQQEDSVVHFILRESFDSVKQWVATINLEDLSLEYKLYEDAIKEPNTRYEVDNMFENRALLPSQLCPLSAAE